MSEDYTISIHKDIVKGDSNREEVQLEEVPEILDANTMYDLIYSGGKTKGIKYRQSEGENMDGTIMAISKHDAPSRYLIAPEGHFNKATSRLFNIVMEDPQDGQP